MYRIVIAVLVAFTTLSFAQTPPPKRPIADVIAQLSDKSPEIRSKAAWTLGHDYKDDPARFDPLEKSASSDPEANVRTSALIALSPREIGKAARWQKLYLKLLTSDASEYVREIAARYLTPAEAATVPTLVAVFDKEKVLKVRNQIIDALVEGKVAKLADILIKIVETHPQPGRAVEALARTGDPRAIPALRSAAKRGVGGSSGGALSALAMIKDPAVDDVMLEFLDGTEDEQWAAVVAIVNSGRAPDPRQTPKVIKIWQAEDKATRKRSYTKLKKYDNGEDDDDVHNLTRLLRGIAEAHQAPCEARSTAKGELKTYLTKILPKVCGKS